MEPDLRAGLIGSHHAFEASPPGLPAIGLATAGVGFHLLGIRISLQAQAFKKIF